MHMLNASLMCCLRNYSNVVIIYLVYFAGDYS